MRDLLNVLIDGVAVCRCATAVCTCGAAVGNIASLVAAVGVRKKTMVKHGFPAFAKRMQKSRDGRRLIANSRCAATNSRRGATYSGC